MRDREVLGSKESIVVGAMAGVVQTIASLPFWNMKVRVQCGYPFTLQPRTLYTGIFPAMGSITLMSASQVLFSSMVHRMIYGRQTEQAQSEDAANQERMLSAVFGGISSTIISNPVGVVITQIHKHNCSFMESTYFLNNQYGLRRFYLSFFNNSVVNATFTFGFFGAYPFFKSKFDSYFKHEILSIAASGCSLGVMTGVISQPFDTVKTMQEKHADLEKRPTIDFFREVYKSKGIRGFYAGFFPAVASTTLALIAAGVAVEKAENHFSKHRK